MLTVLKNRSNQVVLTGMEHILLYGVIALLLTVAVLIIMVSRLTGRLNSLSQGTKGASLENIISENNTSVHRNRKMLDHHTDQINQLQDDILNTFGNIGIIRFNPYKDTGGNQSFAIALLNNKNDGVIISSLYTQDRVNVFAKPIINGTSEFRLTDEEQQAILKAQE